MRCERDHKILPIEFVLPEETFAEPAKCFTGLESDAATVTHHMNSPKRGLRSVPAWGQWFLSPALGLLWWERAHAEDLAVEKK